MTSPETNFLVDQAIEAQRSWAIRNQLELNKQATGFAKPMGGLVRGELYTETLHELQQGAGGELNRIHSLRSSTALSLNVFEPWRPRPSRLGSLLGIKANEIRFEVKQPTGLSGVSPHLDVLVTGSDSTVGIEAKFLEMYTPKTGTFADSYFSDPDLWDDMSEARQLAEQIGNGERQFKWLQADQLLKHALGLNKNQADDFRLVLVWYRIDGSIADEVDEEIGRFTRSVSSDFHFSALTYQDLVSRLVGQPEPTPGYFGYLAGRYQLGRQQQRDIPLVAMGNQRALNRRRDLEDTIRNVKGSDVRGAYYKTVAKAPQRPIVGKPFIVSHTGGGDMSNMMSERVIAKAVFNARSPIQIGDLSIDILDYEVPLRSREADRGIGEIDLLGIDESSRRLSIIELKVAPNSDTPLKALFQGLRYSAILDANRYAVAREIEAEFGVSNISWPASIAVAADRPYWQGLRDTPEAGDWRGAMMSLVDAISSLFGIEVHLVDLGDLVAEPVNGLAQLSSVLEVSLV